MADAGFGNGWEWTKQVERGCQLLVAPERVGGGRGGSRRPTRGSGRWRGGCGSGWRQKGLRQATLKPVIGWIQSVLGYRRFLLGGLQKVRGE